MVEPIEPTGKSGRVFGMAANLVHGRRIVEPAVQHDASDRIAVADVVERIAVQDHEIGQLAGFERAEILVEAEIARAAQRSSLQGLERRHPALREHPQLPVRAEALQLAVRAELHRDAGVEQLPLCCARWTGD